MVGGGRAGSSEGCRTGNVLSAGDVFAEAGDLLGLTGWVVDFAEAGPFPFGGVLVTGEETGYIAGFSTDVPELKLSFETCDVSSSATSSSEELGDGGLKSGAFFLGGDTLTGAAYDEACLTILSTCDLVKAFTLEKPRFARTCIPRGPVL